MKDSDLVTMASFRQFLLLIGCDPGGNVMACYEALNEEHQIDLPQLMAEAGKFANSIESMTGPNRHKTAYSVLKGSIVSTLTERQQPLPYIP